MEKKDLKRILDNLLLPLGFKSKGNNWALNGKDIAKIVNLQKSQYSNSYYINYGYVLSSIPYDGAMHVYNRIAGKDKVEQQEITDILDLDTDIEDIDRAIRLKEILNNKLMQKIATINSEEDILNELKTRPHLNDIPLVVKEHFKLEI